MCLYGTGGGGGNSCGAGGTTSTSYKFISTTADSGAVAASNTTSAGLCIDGAISVIGAAGTIFSGGSVSFSVSESGRSWGDIRAAVGQAGVGLCGVPSETDLVCCLADLGDAASIELLA